MLQTSHFFAGLLDVTQEKRMQYGAKRALVGAVFSFEDAAKGAPCWLLAAAAGVVVAAGVAADIAAAAVAHDQQKDQNPDPAPTVEAAADTIVVTTHKKYLRNFSCGGFPRSFHGIPKAKNCDWRAVPGGKEYQISVYRCVASINGNNAECKRKVFPSEMIGICPLTGS